MLDTNNIVPKSNTIIDLKTRLNKDIFLIFFNSYWNAL